MPRAAFAAHAVLALCSTFLPCLLLLLVGVLAFEVIGVGRMVEAGRESRG